MALWKLIRPLAAAAVQGPAIRCQGCQIPSMDARLLRTAVKKQNPSVTTDRVDSADADEFGNLSSGSPAPLSALRVLDGGQAGTAASVSDDNMVAGYRRLSATDRRHAPIWYGRQIEKLGRDGKVAEAIRLFEVDMLEKDRVMPTPYVFTALIGVLGRAGYSKKAFQLFNKMKAMGLEPEEPTYTALFNACANSPWREDGLQRATQLRQLMRAKDIAPSRQTYGAIVKAMAKCGKARTAFEVIDEMMAARLQPDAVTFSSIMMACINDKSCGFRLMVEVWKLLLNSGIRPDIFHYNLLLAAAEYCGVGDSAVLLDMRPVLVGLPQVPAKLRRKQLSVGPGPSSASRDSVAVCRPAALPGDSGSSQIKARSALAATSDAASAYAAATGGGHAAREPRPTGRQVQADASAAPAFELLTASGARRCNAILSDDGVVHEIALSTPSGRLSALGGVETILQKMDADGARPNSKTFTMLLHLLPRCSDSGIARALESHLLAAADSRSVELDATFFNQLARSRALSGDRAATVDVLGLMSERRLDADVQTFACIAMSCHGESSGMELLRVMKAAKVSPNIVVFNILMGRARSDFMYRIELCKEMEVCSIKPDSKFLDIVSKAIGKMKRDIVLQEKGLKVTVDRDTLEKQSRAFSKFMLYYDGWRKRMPASTDRHPWEDYRYKKDDIISQQDPIVSSGV